MKITFLIPPPLDNKLPAERIFGCNYGIYPQPNIFMLYPATVLRNMGHAVKVKDCTVECMNRNEFLKYVESDDSEIYVFYTVFLSRKTDILARDLIEKVNKNAKFVFMATEPSSHPRDFVDGTSFVIRGEPEETIEELVSRLEKSDTVDDVKGISYLSNGEVRHNPPRDVITDLDTVPFPDRTLLEMRHYHNPKLSSGPLASMITSRGCVHKCYYCVPNSLSFAREIEFKNHDELKRKPPVRLRSVKNVVEELSSLRREGFRSISFLDDQFIWGKERTIRICDALKELDFEWSCLTRADHANDEDIVRAMAAAGCRYVDIGVESFVQDILDDIGKEMHVRHVYEVVRLLKKYNIEQELNILLASSPLETEETIRYTLRELKRLDVDYVLFSICTPFPCTEFNRIAKEKGWMIEQEYRPIDPIKESFISYPHLSKWKLDKIIKHAYLEFYFCPRYVLKKLRRVRSKSDFLNKLRAAATILR